MKANGRDRDRKIWKGLVAGMAGGLAATVVMSAFQKAWSTASEAVGSDANGGSGKRKGEKAGKGENPTIKVANKISQSVRGRRVAKKQKETAGAVVHYAFGTAMGGLYGVATEVAPTTKSLAGMPFGTALFIGADQVALPLLKLTPGPTESPVSSHVYGLASHFVYGASTELVRRMVRGWL